MRDKGRPGTWQSWLAVAVGGAGMVGVFALAGGVTGGTRGVAVATAAGTTSSSSTSDTSSSTASDTGGTGPRVVGLTTPRCAMDSLSGAINVSHKFTGPVTLGLFAIADPQSPLVRSFTDTGERATVDLNGVYRGQFTFTTVPEGPSGYLVAVLPPSGTLDPNTQYVESQVVPTCNTVTTTLTDTETDTTTTTTQVTTTLIQFSTVTQRLTITQSSTDTCVWDQTVLDNPVAGAKQPHTLTSSALC